MVKKTVTDNEFSQKVYEAVKKIPFGKVSTYKRIAIEAGSPNACRAVGNILHHNPFPRVISCHRVVSSTGKLTAAFAFGGAEAHKQLLLRENIQVDKDYKVDLKKYLFTGK
jgi:O-6-methylguanine DNA methyltransferase